MTESERLEADISIPLSGVSGVRRERLEADRLAAEADFNPVIRGEWGAPGKTLLPKTDVAWSISIPLSGVSGVRLRRSTRTD